MVFFCPWVIPAMLWLLTPKILTFLQFMSHSGFHSPTTIVCRPRALAFDMCLISTLVHNYNIVKHTYIVHGGERERERESEREREH